MYPEGECGQTLQWHPFPWGTVPCGACKRGVVSVTFLDKADTAYSDLVWAKQERVPSSGHTALASGHC